MGYGLAKTQDFMLSTATVMVGPQADLNDLNPATHSIGLVKNFSITGEPTYTELTQGIKGYVIESVMTGNPIRCAMESYEYTAKNLTYSTGLDGGNKVEQTASTTLSSAVTASPAVSAISVTLATGFTVGKYVMIEVDSEDHIIVRKITAVTGTTITLDSSLPAIPNAAIVYVVNEVEIGSKTAQPFLSALIVGKLTNNKKVVISMPKIRITKGFNLGFATDNYGNLPFEFQLYDLVSNDANYADYKNSLARLFVK